MASVTKNAILRAMIEGVLTDLMIKTNVTNVYVDDSTTLAAKLSEIITSLNNKATASALTSLQTQVNALPTEEQVTAQVNAAVNALINGAPETADTLKELADAIAGNTDLVDALNAAIGNKADKTTVETIQAAVNSLGALAQKSLVSEIDLDDALKEKVNAASDGNHSHPNKDVLDGITADRVAAWDGKSKVYVQSSTPAGLTANDLFIQLI